MRRLSHDLFATIFSVVYLGLAVNLMLLVGCLPLVALLVVTDPALSWPWLALAAALAAPAVAGAFRAFREHAEGGAGPFLAFVRGWRAGWLKTTTLGALAVAAIVVLLVDVRALSSAQIGVLIVPVLAVLVLLVSGVALVSVVAVAEVPTARVRDVVRASVYLAARRWYLTAVSLVMLAVQAVVFTTAPALAIGLTAAPILYLAWSNSRFTLRPVLDDAVDVSRDAAAVDA